MKDKKREHLVKIIKCYLETSKSLMEYYKSVAETRKGKLTCTKSIKAIEQAMIRVNEIKHIEILEYLYSTFMGNNVIAYSVSGKVVNSPKLAHYDTENGFAEFQEMLKEQKEIAEEKERKRQESLEALKKAKEMGKKVEMVYDKETNTTKPMIIEDSSINWYNKSVDG